MVTCPPCAGPGLRNFVFGFLAQIASPCTKQAETPFLLPSSKEEPLILLQGTPGCFCWGQDSPRTSYLHGRSLHLQDFPSKLALTALCSGLGCPQKEREEQVTACLSIPEAHLISLFWSRGLSPPRLSP